MEPDETEYPARTHVSIRIFAPNLLPEEITQNLELTPNRTHHQSDYPRNDSKYSAYKHGMWMLNSNIPEDQPLEEHLNSLLTLLEPKKSYIQSLAKHATVDFCCTLYAQNGFQVSPQLLKRIADLEITFGVTVYPE